MHLLLELPNTLVVALTTKQNGPHCYPNLLPHSFLFKITKITLCHFLKIFKQNFFFFSRFSSFSKIRSNQMEFLVAVWWYVNVLPQMMAELLQFFYHRWCTATFSPFFHWMTDFSFGFFIWFPFTPFDNW